MQEAIGTFFWKVCHIYPAAGGLKGRELGKMEAFFAGGTARGVAAAATVPFTIVKTRMEYQGAGAQMYKVLPLLGGYKATLMAVHCSFRDKAIHVVSQNSATQTIKTCQPGILKAFYFCRAHSQCSVALFRRKVWREGSAASAPPS